ncbi:MAG: GTP-binding protein [Variovorax sp.]
MDNPQDRTPVSVLTGFLGSGKTTLLNAWLASPELSDAAVIVNEFGEIGIDHSLIASSNDNTIELSTGCLCCTVRGDLVETLRDLTEKRARGEVRPYKRLLIETTGLADPIPVIQALITFPVARVYRLARVITVVDAVLGLDTIERHPEALKQVAVADELIISKTDLDASHLPDLRARLATLNPGAPQRLVAEAGLLDSPDVYDPATKPELVMQWLRADRYDEADDGKAAHAHDHHHEDQHSIRGGHNEAHEAGELGSRHQHDINRHSKDIGSFCLTFDQPLHWEHVSAWLDALVMAHGADLLRVKGVLDIVGQDRPIVVQAVQRLFHPPVKLAAWPAGSHQSRIVFITRGLSRDFVSEVLDIIRRRKPTENTCAL